MKYFDTKKDSLEEAISKAINEKPDSSRELKESKMGAFFLDMQIDANEMSERDFIKKYQGEMGMTARELKDLYREMTESFSKMNAKDLEEKAGKYLRYSDLLLQKGRLMAKNKNTMMIDREIEKEKRKLGIKDSFDAKLDEMVQENDEYEKFFNAALKKFGVKSPADLKTTEKKKEFFNYVDNNYKAKNEDLDEDIKGFKPHVGPRDTLSYHLPKQKKSMKAFFDLVSKHPKVKNVKQETLRGRGGTVSKIDYDTDKNTQAALMRELDKLEKKFGEYAGQTNVVEEVHPMVKAAALATTVWAERRHIDPADVDVKATAADRKAADKNIIIQLRRAQDMEKQTGRADQSGIEFLDKKKQKVDPKIINKALDMFDKMKPNDKQKMQQAIGKSYRDLLKTVQRGRV